MINGFHNEHDREIAYDHLRVYQLCAGNWPDEMPFPENWEDIAAAVNNDVWEYVYKYGITREEDISGLFKVALFDYFNHPDHYGR